MWGFKCCSPTFSKHSNDKKGFHFFLNYVGDIFATRAKNARLAQIFPWVFLEVFICGESSPKIQIYNEQKAISALTREKSKCHN